MTTEYINPYMANGIVSQMMRPLDEEEKLIMMIEMQTFKKHGCKVGPGWDRINQFYRDNPGIKSIEMKETWSRIPKETRKLLLGRPGKQNGMYGTCRTGSDNPNYGNKMTDEAKQRISQKNTGKKPTDEVKQRMSERRKELWSDPDYRAKMSESRKGIRPPSPKGKLWWNNGTKNHRSTDCPGEGWTRGRIKV